MPLFLIYLYFIDWDKQFIILVTIVEAHSNIFTAAAQKRDQDYEEKIFLDISQKNLVPRMLSHRVNVRTSKFWRKSKETERIFFENLPRAYKDLI